MSSDRIIEQEQIIEELRQENTRLKSRLTLSPRNDPMSRQKLDEWINNELDNPENHITLMPKYLEKKLKSQIFGMFLDLLDRILESTKIEFMGQEISFNMKGSEHNVASHV